jgi:hypothetical protein
MSNLSLAGIKKPSTLEAVIPKLQVWNRFLGAKNLENIYFIYALKVKNML